MKDVLDICFDLDDTLIANTHKYHRPIWECGLIISEALGHESPYPPDLVRRHGELDMEMAKEFGFDAKRFPTSWVRMYEILCGEVGREPDGAVKERLYATAARFAEGPFTPFDGVLETLDLLEAEGHRRHLVTAGDDELQRRKIRESGLAPHFTSVNVTPMKKKDILAGIVGGRPERGVMIGDSKRSDIVPAVELGMIAVWVPSRTWNFAHAEIDEGFHTLKSVTELPELLRRLGHR